MKTLLFSLLLTLSLSASAFTGAMIGRFDFETRLPGLILYIDADRSFTNQANGSAISTGRDLSGNNITFGQASSTLQPLFTNSMLGRFSGVLFDGLNDVLMSVTNGVFSLTNASIFIVCNTNWVGNGASCFDMAVSNAADQEFLYWGATTGPTFYHNTSSGGVQAYQTNAWPFSKWMVNGAVFGMSTNDITPWVNNSNSPVKVGTGTFVNYQITNRCVSIGSRITGGSSAKLQMLKVAAWNRKLSASEAFWLRCCYLAQYGANNLP